MRYFGTYNVAACDILEHTTLPHAIFTALLMYLLIRKVREYEPPVEKMRGLFVTDIFMDGRRKITNL
jgi:hypothetical protein